MSYRVIFKGRIDDAVLDDERGKLLAEKWDSGELVGRIEIDGSFYEASAIKAVVKDHDTTRLQKEKEELMDYYHAEGVKFSTKRAELMQLSVRERARDFYNVDMARMVWRSLMGYVATEQEIEEVIIPKSEAWLAEHPTFHAASPTAYIPNDVIKRLNSKIAKKTENDIFDLQTLTAIQSLQLAHRVLQA